MGRIRVLFTRVLEAIRWRLLRLAEFRFLHPDEIHKWHETQCLRSLFTLLEVDCVFDVGANRGTYAEFLRKQVGYKGRIISFEPIPVLADLVRAKAASDSLWSVEQVALDSETGHKAFQIMEKDVFSSLGTPLHSESPLFQASNQAKESIDVQTERLDEAFSRLKKVFHFTRPFLKLDTQGYDVQIVRGGSPIMDRFVGLQSELAIKRLYHEAVEFREALQVYFDLGFELSALVPNTRDQLPVLVESDCIMVNKTALKI